MPPVLTTPRLRLDGWQRRDLTPYAQLVAERDPRTPAQRRRALDTAELDTRLRDRQAELADTGLALFAVRVHGAFTGYCGLTAGHASVAEPELAYELLQCFHGCGYATEAAGAVVHSAARTGRQRVWASVRPWNAPSLRVLTKIGFVLDGRVDVDDSGESLWWRRDLTDDDAASNR